jgi:hemoglobin
VGATAPPPFRHRDLDDPGEIAEMVRRFYREVAQDEILGPIFDGAMAVDWAEHIPKLTRYWERMLLGLPGYDGHPMEAHRRVRERSPFAPDQFDRWLELFVETVDGGWVGPVAQLAKQRAVAVATAISRQLLEGESWSASPPVSEALIA